MILIWIILGVVGGFVGRAMGIMVGELVLLPLILLARGAATVLGWVAGWAKRLP